MPTYGLEFNRKEHLLRVGINTRFKKGMKHTQEWKDYISSIFKGRKFSKSTRRKMSKALLGNKRSYKGGNYCLDCGEKLSGYKPKKCGSCSQKGLSSGEKNPMWKGGKSFELYTSLFNRQLKDKIRVRDNFICQLCGIPELECKRRLSIHHIDYVKKNCKENNLISLCNKCNTKVNQDRDKWTKYFLEKMENKYGCNIWA